MQGGLFYVLHKLAFIPFLIFIRNNQFLKMWTPFPGYSIWKTCSFLHLEKSSFVKRRRSHCSSILSFIFPSLLSPFARNSLCPFFKNRQPCIPKKISHIWFKKLYTNFRKSIFCIPPFTYLFPCIISSPILF